MPSDQGLGVGYRVAIDIGEIDPDEDYSDQEFQQQASSKRRNKLALKNAKYEEFWAKEKAKPAHLQKQQYPVKVWPKNRFSQLAQVEDLTDFWEIEPHEGLVPPPYLDPLEKVPGLESLTLTVKRPAKH
jgi:hypothetical protein